MTSSVPQVVPTCETEVGATSRNGGPLRGGGAGSAPWRTRATEPLPSVDRMIETTPRRSPAGLDSPAVPRVRWGGVGLFILLAFGLSWLVVLPLWLGDGLRDPLVPVYAVAMMATPTIAALVVVLGVMRTPAPARFLGLVLRRPGRTALYALAAAVGAFVLVTTAVLLGGATGVVPLAVGPRTVPALLEVPLLAVLIGVAAVGEEIGWRGFLLPALRPLGTWPSMVITGTVWGLWHAPLVLLGYNFGTTDPVAVPLMVPGTVLIGILLAWLRMRTGSIWAGALTHGTINASTSLVLVALLPVTAQDPAVSLLGWVGWLVVAAAVAVLVATRTLRWTDPVPDLARPRDLARR